MTTRSDRVNGPRGPALRRLVPAAWVISRILAGAALLLTLLATILGRNDRREAPKPVDSAGLPMRIDALSFGPKSGPDVFVDPESGRTIVAALPRGGELGDAAWSPWRDGRGRTQLVGSWRACPSKEVYQHSLVRISQPDGAVLDSLPVVGLPNWSGAPCWSPDRPGLLLLAGGDGSLYRLDFGGPGTPTPQPVAWTPGPGKPRVAYLGDLAWPRIPRFGGRVVLASLCTISAPVEAGPDEQSIWWLRVDPEGTAVDAAGPLIRGDVLSPTADDNRFPVASADVGEPTLAWLARPRGRGGAWSLRVAPLEFDADTGMPFARAEMARTLAEDCASAAPVFTGGGRWISHVPAVAGPGLPLIRRLSLREGGGGREVAFAPGPPGRRKDIEEEAIGRGRSARE